MSFVRQNLFFLFLLFLAAIIYWQKSALESPAEALAQKHNIDHLKIELSLKDQYKFEQRHLDLQNINNTNQSKVLDNYVVARLFKDDKTYPIEMRNRGTFHFHRDFKRKSWRVKSPFSATFLDGALRVNLSRSRLPHFEDHLAYSLAHELGRPAPHSELALLTLNKEWHGAYHLSDQMDANFLAKNNLPYGPIFGELKTGRTDGRKITEFSAALHPKGFTIKSPWSKGFTKFENTAWQYLSLRDEEKLGTTEPLNGLLLFLASDAQTLKEGFAKHFDLPAYLDWLSLQNLGGSIHTDLHNIRLYYNPASNKWQLFSWDLLPFQDYWSNRFMPLQWTPYGVPWMLTLNSIPEFGEARNRHIWKILTTKFTKEKLYQDVDALYNTLKDIYEQDPERSKLNILETDNAPKNDIIFSMEEFAEHHKELKHWIDHRYQYIAKTLHLKAMTGLATNSPNQISEFVVLKDDDAGAYLKSFSLPKDNFKRAPQLEIYFDQNFNSKIDAQDQKISVKAHTTENAHIYEVSEKFLLLSQKKIFEHPEALKKVNPPNQQIIAVTGNYHQALPIPTAYRFLVRSSHELASKLSIQLQNSILEQNLSVKFLPVAKLQLDNLAHGKNFEPDLQNHFATASPSKTNKTTEWKDRVSLNKTFFLPTGETLKIHPGTRVELAPKTSIMVFGKIQALGTKDAPIVFTSQSPDQNWGVLALNNSRGENLFDHVTIERASEARIRHIPFSGALSAYNSNIKIKNCIIRHNLGDDGINVKFGKAHISDCKFTHNTDAIDLDFTEGQIHNNEFIDNRNDSLDLGDAVATATLNRFIGSGDKAISAGGDSKIFLNKNTILKNKIGIAIKDAAQVHINGDTIQGNTLGLILFSKNRDYKLLPPFASMRAGDISGNELNVWREKRTIFVQKGGSVADNTKDKDQVSFDWSTLYL